MELYYIVLYKLIYNITTSIFIYKIAIM